MAAVMPAPAQSRLLMSGFRAFCAMKHIGMDVVSDALVRKCVVHKKHEITDMDRRVFAAGRAAAVLAAETENG